MTTNFFAIIGAQKSASTFLHECLLEHPDVYMPYFETPHYEDPYYKIEGRAGLEILLQAGERKKALGIKRPDYLAKPECPARIAADFPSAKLIVVLRDPVDRAVSAYFWYIQNGNIPALPLNEGVEKIISNGYIASYPRSIEVLDYGFYAKHILRYLEFFPREQILVLLHENFRKDVQEIIRHTYNFICVDPDYRPKATSRRPKQSVYSLTRLRWLRLAQRYFFYDYYQVENQVATYPTKNILRRLIYYTLLGVDRYLLEYLVGNKKPELDKALEHRLRDIYREDIAQVESLLGITLQNWR